MYNQDKSLKIFWRISLFIFIISAMVIGVFAMVKGLDFFLAEQKELIYSYVIKTDSEYRVFLKDNEFIDKEYLGENEMYVTELVDNIEINFNYSFIGSKPINLNYEYEIYGILTIEYRTGESSTNRLWYKRYPLVFTQGDSDEIRFDLEDSVVLNYDIYNSRAKAFGQQLQLPTNAYFTVYFDTTVKSNLDDKKTTQTITIPLDLMAFNITKDAEQTINEEITEIKKAESKTDFELAALGGVLVLSSIFSFLVLFKKLFNIRLKSEYEITRDKILKDYGDVIIEVITPIEKKDLSIIEVKNFNEMIDLEEELRIPIMFYENPEKEQGEFSLLHGNIIYIFEI